MSISKIAKKFKDKDTQQERTEQQMVSFLFDIVSNAILGPPMWMEHGQERVYCQSGYVAMLALILGSKYSTTQSSLLDKEWLT